MKHLLNTTATAALVFTLSTTMTSANETVPAGVMAQSSAMQDGYKNYQFYGWAEYGVETDTADAGIGMNYFLTDRATLYGEIDFIKLDNEEADFDTFNFGIDYAISYNVSTYLEIEFDEDFDYQDVILGVSFIY